MVAYLRARTAFFDRVVLDAIARGTTQFVIAAAGYDGRSLRYATPGGRWFELDHPSTQADKRDRLARLGITAPGVTFVSADFRTDDVADRLRTTGLDGAAPTLFTVEGVVAYLDHDVVATLFGALRAVAATGSLLAVSLSTTSSDGTTTQRRVRFQQAVAALGEPLAAPLTPDGATTLFAATGWREVPPLDDDAGARRRATGLVVLAPTG